MLKESNSELPENLWNLPFVNRGISGIVFAINEFSVIKTPTGGDINAQELETERRIFERLGEHPRIVRLLYVHRNMIVLERLLYPLRTRTLELREKGVVPSTEEVLKWSAQAAEGMQYFHEKNVFQVDVGLHNMLLDRDDNIKYCDFSGSSIDGERSVAVVSPHAQHPGIKIGSPTIQSELFSLGSALYEISTTRKAYEGMKETELQDRYTKGEYPKTDHLLLGPVILKCWCGKYRNAGETAAEIRSMQRKIKLGDLNLSLQEIILQRKSQNITQRE